MPGRSTRSAHRTAVSAILLASLFLLSGCNETLLHDLSELQANRIQVLLAREGISAQKSRDAAGWAIEVGRGETTKALSMLETWRVLDERPTTREERSHSFVQSREERSHYLERDLAYGIEETLERMPGVLEARVHLRLHTRRELPGAAAPDPETASVLLLVAPQADAPGEAVRKLVAGASGVPAENVIVVATQVAEGPPAAAHSSRAHSSRAPSRPTLSSGDTAPAHDSAEARPGWRRQAFSAGSAARLAAVLIPVLAAGLFFRMTRQRKARSAAANRLSSQESRTSHEYRARMNAERLRPPDGDVA